MGKIERRVHKFRAWDRERKRLVTEFDKSNGHTRQYEIQASEDGELYCYYIDDKEDFFDCDLMQFTGLHDALGDEIYEGDIVTGNENEKYTFVIEFVRIGYKAVGNGGRDIFDIPPHWWIIGNIYQNPGLLKLN